MPIIGKVWGSTEQLLGTPLFDLHKLIIKSNSQCSMHKHNFKHNAFIVLEGVLYIDVEKNDYALVDTTTLSPGDCTTVKPGEFHKFRTAHQPCVALECYYCEPLSEDIVRRTVGSHGNKQPRKKR